MGYWNRDGEPLVNERRFYTIFLKNELELKLETKAKQLVHGNTRSAGGKGEGLRSGIERESLRQ